MAKRIVDEEMRFSIIVNGDKAQKELYELEKNTRNLTQRNKELRQEQARMVAQGQKGSASYKALTAEIKKNGTELKSNKLRMSELQKQIGVTGLTMAQLSKRASELRLQLRHMVPGSAQYKKYVADLKEVNAQLGKVKAQGNAAKFSIGGIANGFNKYAALGASAIATITGVVFSIQKLIDFNGKLSDSISDVQKTTGMTKKEVEEMTKEFGLLQTRTSRINLLKIAEEGGRIGIAKEEISDFVRVMDKAVVALSDSFPGGVEETASKLGKLKLLFKETKDQKVDKAYNSIGSAINDLGAQGVATEVNIANFATRVGSLPDALKPSIGDALALGAAFEENGIQAEIAGRAYSILLNQAAQESEKFAEVMGLTNKEVQDLINKNPLDFLIKFAKGLKGMNATDTAKTLEYLGVQADGANKVLGALSNNTERFGELMELSNRSMQQGTSLINEYNIKNNNFQATLDKINRVLKGMIAMPFSKLLESWANGLAKLLGVSDDLTDQFYKQNQASFENARANRQLANSSEELLKEYESLTKDGVKPTIEEKQRLDEITLLLKDRLGDSVVAIDKETGAFLLNTEAVKNQIKLKRLAADDEAATLASRLKGIQEEEKRLKAQLPALQQELEARNRLAEKSKGAQFDYQGNPILGGKGITQDDARAIKAATELGEAKGKLAEQEQKRLKILEQLRDLNFTEADVDLLFQDPTTPPTTGAGGGSGGFNIPKGGGGASTKEKQRKSLLDWQRETEDARIAIIADSYKRELEMERVAHERKIADLQSQKVTGVPNATEINKEINKQIELEATAHENRLGTIIEKGIEDRFKLSETEYQTEKQQRQTAHNNEMAALGNNEKAKEALDKKFNADELAREEAHLQEMLAALDELKKAGNFQGMDLSLLTPEQVKEFEALADQLKLKLSEVAAAKSSISGGAKQGGYAESSEDSAARAAGQVEQNVANIDILGFTLEQWVQTFDHLDTIQEKILAVQAVTGAMMNAWKMYTDFQQKNAQIELRNFEKLQDKKLNALDSNLEKGFINQRQHDEAVRALEEETARKRAELEYKQAKTEKEQAIISAIINTSLSIMQAYAQLGPIGGTIAAAFIGTLAAVQIGMIRKQPLPAKGFEGGYYGNMPVQREQDGRVYNASYGGSPTTQMVDKPKYFLAGEGGKDFPEMIIDGKAFRQFDPNFKNALYREIARVKGYESGYYQTQSAPTPQFNNESNTQTTQAMMALLAENTAVLKDLRDRGVEAFLVRSLKTAKDIREDIQDYETLRNKNKR